MHRVQITGQPSIVRCQNRSGDDRRAAVVADAVAGCATGRARKAAHRVAGKPQALPACAPVSRAIYVPILPAGVAFGQAAHCQQKNHMAQTI